MLVPVILIYIISMPMGYIVGQNFVRSKVEKYEHIMDREAAEENYGFVPLFSALVLPLASILAIMQIIESQ